MAGAGCALHRLDYSHGGLTPSDSGWGLAPALGENELEVSATGTYKVPAAEIGSWEKFTVSNTNTLNFTNLCAACSL